MLYAVSDDSIWPGFAILGSRFLYKKKILFLVSFFFINGSSSISGPSPVYELLFSEF